MLDKISSNENHEIDPDNEIREFLIALGEDSQNPPNQDEVIAALARAMLDDFHIFEQAVREGFLWRKEFDTYLIPAMYKNLIYRAIWKQAAKRDPEGWPHKYTNPEQWHRLFPLFLNKEADDEDDEFSDFREFEYDISIRNVGSNPAERVKLLHILMSVYPELLGSKPKILEVGGSAGHLLKALAIGMQLYPTEVMDRDSAGNMVLDENSTALVNQRLTRPAEIGPSVTLDVWPWENDTKTREWEEINTLTPKELMADAVPMRLTAGTELVSVTPKERYKILDAIKTPLVKFAWGDITSELDRLKYFGNSGAGEFDAVYLPTVLQQQIEAKRQDILESAEASGNRLIVQDFVSPHPDDPSELLFPRDIYESDWNYKLLVRDHNGIWQEMLVAQTDRCHKIQLGLGKLSIDGKLVSIKDRL